MSLCAICGGERKSGKTSYTVDLLFGVIVVRDVPASVCSRCGEAWIDDETAKKLQDIVQKARREHKQVEILSLSTIV